MLRQGPIPRFVHGLIEYVAVVALFAAPFVLSFKSGAATAASIIAAILVLVIAASTEGPTGLVDGISLGGHVALDYVLALALIAIPFIAGFSNETAPTAFFIALGVLHMLVTIGTRFTPTVQSEPKGRGGRRSRRNR